MDTDIEPDTDTYIVSDTDTDIDIKQASLILLTKDV